MCAECDFEDAALNQAFEDGLNTGYQLAVEEFERGEFPGSPHRLVRERDVV